MNTLMKVGEGYFDLDAIRAVVPSGNGGSMIVMRGCKPMIVSELPDEFVRFMDDAMAQLVADDDW